VRRKPGTLVPLEASILAAAVQLHDAGAPEFHGYQIAKHLADVANAKLLTAYGTLYRALGRLEDMGLVRSQWEDPQIAANENRPGRRLYSLTSDGAAAARAARADGARKTAAHARRRTAPA
jgi:PadR family transcriptional regulator PadR